MNDDNGNGKKQDGQHYVDAVRQFADHVLTHGKDVYGNYTTPLFIDGMHVDTHEPVKWKSGGEEWILCNMASQQNLFRTLDGVSRVTGNPKYKQAAMEAMQYAFDHLRYGNLLSWGGHMAFDLAGKRSVFASDKGAKHELKCHYPYYELMKEASLTGTVKYIEAVWDSHIFNWSNLEFSRHGVPTQPMDGRSVWQREYMGGEIFFDGKGLTFINAGSDLYYAAGMLHRFTGEEAPLVWAKRLAARYVETRNPQTGLGGYQFSISILPGANGRGDRAIDQFGEQLKAHRPIEATLSVTRQIQTIIGVAGICRMSLAETLDGEAGREFAEWAVEDLVAYGRHAYDAQDNTFHPMLSDGTRLTGLVMEKSGYYGKQGDTLKAAPADLLYLWSYSMGYRLSNHPLLWSIMRSIAAGNGLGDIGAACGEEPVMAVETECSDPIGIFALLELYKTTSHRAYLDLARSIGDNILKHRYHKGFFLPSRWHLYAKFDCIEPLALLHLTSAMRGETAAMPLYCAGKPFFSAAYDGLGHESDNQLIYSRTHRTE